jgi:hypothetical protein
MGTWKPSTLTEVQDLLLKETALLHKSHQQKLQQLVISPLSVPVLDSPGETVYAVARRGNFVLYWSDVEGGWEWELLDKSGALEHRGCNQFELSHITHQLFGDPN